MVSPIPAITPAATASVARRKTVTAQVKLKKAKANLRKVKAVLSQVLPKAAGEVASAALEHSSAAQEKVQEASEELEGVTQLLADEAIGAHTTPPEKPAPGRSGEGAKSLMKHLAKRSRKTPNTN